MKLSAFLNDMRRPIIQCAFQLLSEKMRWVEFSISMMWNSLCLTFMSHSFSTKRQINIFFMHSLINLRINLCVQPFLSENKKLTAQYAFSTILTLRDYSTKIIHFLKKISQRTNYRLQHCPQCLHSTENTNSRFNSMN